MKKIFVIISALCCLSACHKTTEPEPSSAANAGTAEDSSICKRAPLAEFSPASEDTEGSFDHLEEYLDQVHECILNEDSCEDSVQCLSKISKETLLAAADDIQRDATIVRPMEATNIIEILQKVAFIYRVDACDEALKKFESMDEIVIHAGYHDASLLTSFYPYLIRAAQEKDCNAARKMIREMPACMYANANIDFTTLRDERQMGIAGINYQMMHYNVIYMRLSDECGITPEFTMAALGISSDFTKWDQSTGIIPNPQTPMAKHANDQDSDDEEEPEELKTYTCDRAPFEMIPGKPGKPDDKRLHLTEIQSIVLDCMLKSCDQATSCIQKISKSQIKAAIEDMKSEAYIEFDREDMEERSHLYINPLMTIYHMSPCEKAIEAFEKINLEIVQSYGYANTSTLNAFGKEQVEIERMTDCDAAEERMLKNVDPCVLGNSELDRRIIGRKKLGIPGFQYQIYSYGKIMQRLEEKNGCGLFPEFVRIEQIQNELEIEPHGDEDFSSFDVTMPF